MNKLIKSGLILFLLIVVILLYFSLNDPPDQVIDGNKMSIHSVLGSKETKENYALALEPVSFHFPKDAGPHPEFKSEWWYYTGNLRSAEGAEYGYQFTIFRQSIADHRLTGASDWRTNQIYMAHLALTDVKNEQFYTYSKMSRGSVGLAGAESEPFRIWVENWSISGHHDQPVLKATTEV